MRRPAVRGRARRWSQELVLGFRFGALGGRESWMRNVLTAVGVGLGVALLLIAASLPQIMSERDQRTNNRLPHAFLLSEPARPTATSVVTADISTEFRSETVTGEVLRADGDRPKLPPGVDALPRPGEMVVSPALERLLGSPEGEPLAERLGRHISGTIGPAGLLDPGELLFYAGSDTLSADVEGFRTDGFGYTGEGFDSGSVDPVLTVLATLITVVLLVPVAVFIATALRCGGDRRDRRLAALRLVGADIRAVRRIAAGEALFASLLGLVTGFAFFALARLFAGSVRIWGLSAFPSDVVPVPWLAALIAGAVPTVSVLLTLFALRSVVIEPLGVVRGSRTRPRRLWWRLLMPATGVAVLLLADPIQRKAGSEQTYPVPLAVGAILVLLGVTALFPWLVGAVVGRLRGGPLPWQLAVRALQLRSGTATRSVSGIMVAVSGAIALQMVFAGMHEDFKRVTGVHPAWGLMDVTLTNAAAKPVEPMARALRETRGVSDVLPMVTSSARPPSLPPTGDEPPPSASLTVADCPVLRKLARIRSCEDGDTFVVHSSDSWGNDWVRRTARKGEEIVVDSRHGPPPDSVPEGGFRWTLPEDSPTVTARRDFAGWEYDGIYATPGALDPGRLRHSAARAVVTLDESVPDAEDRVRNTAARLDPVAHIWSIHTPERDRKYASIHTGLLAGATGTMVLIAATMVITQIEQLRERRRLLSTLLAFGTRRSTLAWSQLWQTALPVVLGTAVATAGGLVLGAVMLRLIAKPLPDWRLFLPVAGTGTMVILLVTLVSLPTLWRMTRTDGLRTE
ncbi:FtsX-like permease family protein [Streptomyces clavuligerus]|nr:FtsX-like permease family protein [Streptomyces clavuligerus]EDY49728.1 integral membrane protein [Streptomyces clavuligerus]WDN53774.1 FtsX-like permease family protein [Streptomyces clavuligerus]